MKKIVNTTKRVLLIAGPTCSGENTISNLLVAEYPIFKKLVAATTRTMRPGEKEGVEYYFLSKERFFEEIKNKNIIEYTHVKNRDDYYGTYKPDLDEKIKNGFNIIATTDIVGAKYFKENYNATTIFLKAESLDIIAARLAKRDPSISNEELKKRIENAKFEIENEERFYDYIVINRENKLKKAFNEIINIIIKEGYKLSDEQSN